MTRDDLQTPFVTQNKRSQNDNSGRKAVKDPESSRLHCEIERKIEFSTLALNIHFTQLGRRQTAQFFLWHKHDP